MSATLATLDRWCGDRRDAQARNIGHAIKARLGRRGYAWLSERLLLRDICHCSWSEGLELIQELIDAGEFYRVTARGRGRGKGRTFYFCGWVPRPVLERELQDNAMPLAAFHFLERCIAHFRARVSFFGRRNDAGEHQHSLSHERGTTRKDARTARERPARASHGPPRPVITPPVRPPTMPGDPRSTNDGLPQPDEVPEDLRYLYPHRFPEAPRPKRLKGHSGRLERLGELLPFAVQSVPRDD